MAHKKFLHLLFPTLAATLLGLTVSLAASSQSGRPAQPKSRAASEGFRPRAATPIVQRKLAA
jgi:hypothetical protein